MGKIKQGILGPFSGKVGTVVGAIWKGIGVIRALPASMSNPRSEGQVNQRTKFSAVVEFLKPSLAFINLGFRSYAKGMSAYNAAHSYNIKNAITGVAPDFSVDYPNALVSRGQLEGALNAQASLADDELTVTWEDNSDLGNARPDDQVMLLVYNTDRHESLSVLDDPATRVAGTLSTTVIAFPGQILQVYLAFRAANGSMVSNSTHVAELEVG